MKKLILTLVTSCCMIILFAIPVFATSYTFTQGGGPAKIKYDLANVFESTILNAINEACGTTENVYYICRVDPQNTEYLNISIMLDVEVQGIKGNVAYVFDDNHGLYTDSFNTVPYWKRIYISNNGSYMSRYTDAGGTPWNYYPNSGSDQYGPCVVITNMPIFRTKEGLDDYFATGNTSDMIGAEPEYNSEAPFISNAYLKYEYVEDKSGRIFEADLYFTMPELEDTTFNTYVNVVLEGDFDLFQLPTYKVKETLSFSSSLRGKKVYQYTLNECVYDYSENIVKTEEIFNDPNYLILTNKVGLLQGVKGTVNKITYIIYMSNGNVRGDYTKLSIDSNGLQSTKIESGFGMISNPEIGKGTVDIIDGDKDLSGDIANDTDIKDSILIDVNQDVSVNTTGIIGFLKSGFGLIGDDGLIPMLGSIFGFLPKPIIILMVSTFSIVVVVIIAKFVRG